MKKLAFDIARGIEYLHGEQRVHGDLAARNCIVYKPRNEDDVWSVKVGDNACYKVNYEGCYYVKVENLLLWI